MNLISYQATKILLTGIGAALLTGCVSIDLELDFALEEAIHQDILGQTSDRFPDIDPLYISDEVKQWVDDALDRFDSEETRVDKLQDLLFGEDNLYLQYSDKKTHTAMEAYQARSGNCVSAMNLYVAMARYAGVNASFQTVDVQPSWDRRGNLLVLSQHINASGRFNMRRHYIVDFTPEIALQQLTSRVITDLQARALYFNNLGVEALIENDSDQALVYFKNALFLDPQLPIAWNNIATAYNRLGNAQYAVYAYRVAFDLDDKSATAINNLARLYRQAGDNDKAREYEEAILRFNNQNPYFHYAQGNVAFVENDFQSARDYFQRALRLKGEEPDFYIALGMVYQELGDAEEANKMNESALALIAQNAEIYRPSNQKVRIIDKDSILRSSSPGISIILER